MILTKRNKPFYFVCSAILNGNIICEEIAAKTYKQAEKLFLSTYGILSFKTLGPFFKKRSRVIDKSVDIKFGKGSRKAIYNGWNVIAQNLEEPQDHALLIFKKKIDGTASAKPSGNIVIPLHELTYNEEK